MKTNTLPLILASLLTGFAFLHPAQGVVPSPDGGYPGFNTAEGQDALFSLTPTGAANTAIGFHALYSNTTGDSNTAAGADALANNRTGRSSTATGFHALNGIRLGWLTRPPVFALLITTKLAAETQPSVTPRSPTIPAGLIT